MNLPVVLALLVIPALVLWGCMVLTSSGRRNRAEAVEMRRMGSE